MTTGGDGHRLVVLNPASGPDETPAAELGAALAGGEVVEAEGADVEAAVRRAVEAGAEVVAVAGGDGTIRCAAGLVAGTDTLLLPVPAGTRNHFARELGIETLADAGEAWTGGDVRRVDLAEVNGERFVNNSSVGFYAALVRERETHERRMPKAWANVRAAWAQARKGHRFWVRVGDDRYRAWIVFVGNGCYGDTLADLTARQRLDANQLDVRVLRADARLARVRAVVALLLGRSGRSPLLASSTPDEVTIELDGRRRVEVAIDGEVLELDNPLHYRSLPGALAVLVPPDPDSRGHD